jgi:ADP-ribose pyrophosphatase YjhB (NUDIX family)
MNTEMNYCRRCGNQIENVQQHIFKCKQGHTIFNNASPAVGVLLINDKNEVLVVTRAIEPGKGKFDAPGGFCDGSETLEKALERELNEELGLTAQDYSTPEFVLSGIDLYKYKEETLPVLGVIFKALVKPGAKIVAADDAASADFMPIQEIDLENVYFDSVRKGYEYLKNH